MPKNIAETEIKLKLFIEAQNKNNPIPKLRIESVIMLFLLNLSLKKPNKSLPKILQEKNKLPNFPAWFESRWRSFKKLSLWKIIPIMQNQSPLVIIINCQNVGVFNAAIKVKSFNWFDWFVCKNSFFAWTLSKLGFIFTKNKGIAKKKTETKNAEFATSCQGKVFKRLPINGLKKAAPKLEEFRKIPRAKPRFLLNHLFKI